MKKNVMETTNAEIPLPRPARNRQPTKMVQALVPRPLFDEVRKLSRSGDPKHPVTIQSIVEWGLREWVRKVSDKK